MKPLTKHHFDDRENEKRKKEYLRYRKHSLSSKSAFINSMKHSDTEQLKSIAIKPIYASKLNSFSRIILRNKKRIEIKTIRTMNEIIFIE